MPCLPASAPSSSDVPDPRVLVEYRLQERLCDRCYATGQYHFDPLGLTNHRLGALTTRAEKLEARRIATETPAEKIRSFTWQGMAIGDHAYAGALRYFARGDLSAEPLGEQVLRRYLEASLLMAAASARLLQREGIEIAAFNHGLYVPQGVLGEVCRSLDVRVANWNPAYRTSCFIFSHGDTYHHTLMAEPTEAWENMPWTPEMEAQIQEYLKSRWSGTRDWIWFHDEPDEDFAAYAREVGLDLNKPTVALLTNVMWDAQLHYPANAFPSMLDWVVRHDRVLQGPAGSATADPGPSRRDPWYRDLASAARSGDRARPSRASAQRLRDPAGVPGLDLRCRRWRSTPQSSTAPRPASS